jgi:hypothetical protein
MGVHADEAERAANRVEPVDLRNHRQPTVTVRNTGPRRALDGLDYALVSPAADGRKTHTFAPGRQHRREPVGARAGYLRRARNERT